MAAGIAAAVIVIISAIEGARKGGLLTLWSIAGVFAAIILSISLNGKVTAFLNEQIHLDHYVEKRVEKQLELNINSELDHAEEEIQKEFIKALPLPSSWKNTMIENNNQEGYSKILTGTFTGYVAKSIAAMSVNALAFIITFILIAVIFFAVSVAFHIVDAIPVLKQMNAAAGFGLGLLRGFLIVWILLTLLAFASGFGWGQMLIGMVMENPVIQFFYIHNIISMCMALLAF